MMENQSHRDREWPGHAGSPGAYESFHLSNWTLKDAGIATITCSPMCSNRRLNRPIRTSSPTCTAGQPHWYERSGSIFDAIHHTLLAGDREHAAQLLDQHGCLLLMRGEVISLLHWIEAVEPYSKRLPWIAIQKGWALCLTGQVDRAEAALQTAEQLVAGWSRRMR